MNGFGPNAGHPNASGFGTGGSGDVPIGAGGAELVVEVEAEGSIVNPEVGGSASLDAVLESAGVAHYIEPGFVDFVFEDLGAGRTPRAVLDYMGGCGPVPDVQVFFMKTNVGLVRLDEVDEFAVEYSTPLGYNRRYFVEEAGVSEDHRVYVIYSVHDENAGTYELKRLNSKVYGLQRPDFFNQPVPVESDMYRQEGIYYRSPQHTTTVQTLSIAVKTLDPVDAIEINAINEVPSGFHPVWNVQNQEWAPPGGLDAEDGIIFSFTVAHGNGGMQPTAFRARTRTTLAGGRICYSRWRYFIPGYMSPVDYELTSASINCDHDIEVGYPNFLHSESGERNDLMHVAISRYFREQVPCEGGGGGGSVQPPSFIEGGWQPFPPLWRQDWSLQIRAVIPISFIDENDELIGYEILGGVSQSFSGGAGGPAYEFPENQQGQYPKQWPIV